MNIKLSKDFCLKGVHHRASMLAKRHVSLWGNLPICHLLPRENKPSLAAQCSLVETDMISSWRNMADYSIIGK